MKAINILETIGNTPHVRLNRLYPDDYEVWVKVEKTNPGGSIKDPGDVIFTKRFKF